MPRRCLQFRCHFDVLWSEVSTPEYRFARVWWNCVSDRNRQEDQTNQDNSGSGYYLPWFGRFFAPIASITVYLLLDGAALSGAAQATAAIGILMAILWMTEAMPLPITSLLPIVLFPLAGVLEISEATAPYADEIIFLFMGGFMLALAMQRWGLHRRIALLIVVIVGTRPRRLIAGFMVATAFLSMWISNTATTVLMLPIAASIVGLVIDQLQRRGALPDEVDETIEVPEFAESAPAFSTGLMLAVAYSASIGSVGTLIGTPPNLFMRAYLESAYGIEIGFGQWMLVGVPLAIVLLIIAWFLLAFVLYRPEVDDIPGGKALVDRELESLGPLSRAEKLVLTVFLLTAFSWILREPVTGWSVLVERAPWVQNITDTTIAIAAAIALFAIPVQPRKGEFIMNWEKAKELPWNVLLLFGGGLSLAGAVQSSELDEWIGTQVTVLEFLPLILLAAVAAAMILLLTELTSNTATAATFLPILGGVALGIGVDPMLLIIPAALAASCAFMMPVATPPNAIVFGSGYLKIGQMIRAGVFLNVISVTLITIVAFTLASWVFGITY
ncbi:MAG: DASS family sodium-coupled anion symporter [Sphaerobacteraceae bacterium]|nr:MAG: DASS family sodium-coupled anion symporter [Sphaerobacteraceae bacterium]